jgi:hypothetical protein
MSRDEVVDILKKAAKHAHAVAVENDDDWLKTVSCRILDELNRRR